MTSTRKIQIGLIGLAVVVCVLLFIAPKTPGTTARETAMPQAPMAAGSAGMDAYLKMGVQALTPEHKGTYERLLAAANKAGADASLQDSVSRFWDKRKRPDLAAVFAEKMAKSSNAAKDWFKAGDRYFYAVQFCKDPTEVPALYQGARACYESGLKLDPKNVDAKVQLAATWVDGSDQPMKGIGMLREIEKTDSNNLQLQLTLASFSVKSGQSDKAISRFEKVLRIDPSYIVAYLYLADLYEQMGNKEKTIDMLEHYKAETPDVLEKQEIEKSIQKLKK